MMRMHVVSFQVPWPADYGGAIDVYYKLKALKQAGIEIVLHTFCYRGRGDSDMLHQVADEVYFYPRAISPVYLFSRKPFIVKSRCSNLLLNRLASAPANEPILFEGLHTTAFLAHPALKQHFKIVRTHNVEHEYYAGLASATPGLPKRMFYISEAFKLKRHEPVLAHADAILAISESDYDYFASKFGHAKTHLVNCFYNDAPSTYSLNTDESNLIPAKPFLLYHGNLSVEENHKAAMHILKQVSPKLHGRNPLVIAGKTPSKTLCDMIAATPNTILIDSPSASLMHALVERASVHLLFTFQPTGIKLKLLSALTTGRGHCIANTAMANDSALASLCHIADTTDQQADIANQLVGSYISNDEKLRRDSILQSRFSSAAGAEKIIGLIPHK